MLADQNGTDNCSIFSLKPKQLRQFDRNVKDLLSSAFFSTPQQSFQGLDQQHLVPTVPKTNKSNMQTIAATAGHM